MILDTFTIFCSRTECSYTISSNLSTKNIMFFDFALHCYMLWKTHSEYINRKGKRQWLSQNERSEPTRTPGTLSTDVYALCLTEYERSRPLRTRKYHHSRETRFSRWSITSKVSCFGKQKKSVNVYHHHHVMPPARISQTLSRHFSISFIAYGRSSGLHPVSSHSWCMYVRVGRPAFAWLYSGVHRSTSLMSSSLLLQQCPASLVRLTGIVFVMGSRWSYSWCLVGSCCQDLFNIARNILV